MAKKLELTWYGKDKEINVEPRLLIERPELSNTDEATDTENMLIHGDNLLALKALESKYAGLVKCIYIDPPYNTGSAFEHYDDNLEHSIWLNLMRSRLKILKKLLSLDGSIWIQIDDEEQAYLKVLCDEIFGRSNFINMISVNMKNIAGASGGGEDKRIKKNCEYVLVYAKDYSLLKMFKGAYEYEEIGRLVERYRQEGISWKYSSALVDSGKKIYICSTVDGSGDEIRIFKRIDYKIKSVKQIMKEEKLSETEAYNKYARHFFVSQMPQSSIRPRVMEKVKEIGRDSELYSIEYIPKSGRKKGVVYEQFYKGENFRLLAWLQDVSEEIEGVLYKKTLQGTYWDFVSGTKNLTKEGGVEFPNGKKPEALVSRIIKMCTETDDLVLDSFLGSGTTATVAHKMGRRYIGIEMGEHAYTHCKKRLDMVVSGDDKGGISKSVNWQGGGGYRFYELAPTLINKDEFGEFIINPEYSADMLAAAMALHEGFTYEPDSAVFWKQSHGNEKSYLFVTTRHLNAAFMDSIIGGMEDDEYLLIACCSFDKEVEKMNPHISVKKIPQMLLSRCEFDKADYSLNIIHPPVYDDEEGEDEQ